MPSPWKESYDQPRQHIKKQRHYFASEGPSSQGYGFSSSHVWMWELDDKESWALKNWCFWTVVLEKTLESLLDCKEIQPVHPKGNQSWIFIARTDVEAETPILWPPDANSWLIWKDPDDGKDWGQEEKGTTENEMVAWHHWLDGHEFEQAPGVGDGQGSLACCGSWDRKESDVTEWLNNRQLNVSFWWLHGGNGTRTWCKEQGSDAVRQRVKEKRLRDTHEAKAWRTIRRKLSEEGEEKCTREKERTCKSPKEG